MTLLETQKVDILLLDDKLNSGLTAVDSVPALRAVSENIPFIIISNAIDADYLQNKSILDVYDIVDKYHIIQNCLIAPARNKIDAAQICVEERIAPNANAIMGFFDFG